MKGSPRAGARDQSLSPAAYAEPFRSTGSPKGRPESDARVAPLEPSNYRRRFFDKACTKAGIGSRQPKDLRDTFASQLLTSGISLGYVSKQLGHSNIAITARHYARYVEADGYREPIILAEGEVAADVLVHLETEARARSQQQSQQAADSL